jgi:RimJ/RimL family protein N-acetyltransferase
MPAPLIVTERLALRSFEAGDASIYARIIFGDALVMRYLGAAGAVPDAPLTHAKSVISTRLTEWEIRNYSAWALTRLADHSFMGHVGFFVIDGTQTVELGYALGQAYWGQGYATEAARAALRYAYEHTSLDEIIAVAYPENTASQRVMEKIGMRRQGLTSDYYDLELAMYSINREQYRAQTPSTP